MANICPQFTANGARDDVDREKGEDRKRPKNSHQPRDHGRDRSRFRDDKPGPRVEKSGQRPVAVADVDILAAGLRLHRSQFGISERAEKREQSAHHPCQINQLGRAHGLHHFRGHEKNSAADDRAHDHRGGVAHPQVAGEFRTRRRGPRDIMCDIMRDISHVGRWSIREDRQGLRAILAAASQAPGTESSGRIELYRCWFRRHRGLADRFGRQGEFTSSVPMRSFKRSRTPTRRDLALTGTSSD